MRYTVGFAVDGRAFVEARGKSPAEAAERAIVDFCDVDKLPPHTRDFSRELGGR